MFDERHPGLGTAPAYDNEISEHPIVETETLEDTEDKEPIYESKEGQLQAAKVYFDTYLGPRQKIDMLSRAIVSARESALGQFSGSHPDMRTLLEERFKKIYDKNIAIIESFDYAAWNSIETRAPVMDFVYELSDVYKSLQVFAAQVTEVGQAIKEKVLLEIVHVPELSQSRLPGTATSQQLKDIVAYYQNQENPEAMEKVKLFSRLLVFEENFEKNLNQLFTEDDVGKVESSVFDNIEDQAIKIESEQLDKDHKPIYFPVGISKDMDKWQEVLAGNRQIERPVDMYAYLLWLNQLGDKAKLVVCDEAQVPNYTTKFGVSEDDARKTARMIGAAEREHYEAVIRILNLENIQVVNYSEFINENKDSFEDWQEVVQKLADSPLFAETCKAMAQGSVDNNATEEEKRKYLNYALEELSTILSTDGLKVSHQKEARYDAIAMVLAGIKNKLSEASTRPQQVFTNMDHQEFLESFDEVVRGLQIKTKSVETTTKDQQTYIKGVENVLSKLQNSLKNQLNALGFDKDQKQQLLNRGKVYDAYAKQVKLDFIVPNVASRSIGRKTVKGGGVEDVVSHKEPYASYFPTDLSFMESDQVLASLEGSAVGKILALNHEKQMEYFEDTMKPLITRFIAQLPNLPEQYFDDVEASDEMIIRDCKNIASVAESIYFVQKYIQRPVAIEKKYS